jgi:EAL domain-containing protein (putative c-di-GMP-specific phosphodiesterase class I)/HAMP domain-containing protein
VRLRAKVLIGLVALEVAIVAGVVGGFRWSLDEHYVAEAQTNADNLAAALATLVLNPVLTSDVDTVSRTVRHYANRPDVVSLRVTQNRRTLAETPGQAVLGANAAVTTRARAPVRVGNSVIGEVEVGLNDRFYRAKLNAATRRALWLALALLALALGIVFAFTQRLTGRVLALRNTAREIATGKFGHHVPVTGNDEISDTAKAFNLMSANLGRETDLRLREQQQHARVREGIEARVALRTSEAMASRRAIEYEFLEDRLTHFATRALYYDRFQQLKRAHPKATLALVLIDLSSLRHLAQTMNQAATDRILGELAQRLLAMLPEGETAARPGADEFAVLINADGQDLAARTVAMLERLGQPVMLLDMPYTVRLRAAVATTAQATTAEVLLANAYRALVASAEEIVCYGPEHAANQGRMIAGEELMRALAEREFTLYYQPRVATSTGWLVGLQALLRWQHPRLGLLEPDAFLTQALQMGLARDCTSYVIEHALADRLRGAFGEVGQVPVTVSVDEETARDPDFPRTVADLIARMKASPQWLEISISERILIAHHIDVVRNMRALAELGVRLSLDDFGTAYSCLASLTHGKRIVDTLRIDRTLILEANTTGATLEMIDAAIGYAHSHGILTVAEGIETRDMQAFVEVRGCDAIQGYYIQRPAPAENLREWLAQRFTRKVGNS